MRKRSFVLVAVVLGGVLLAASLAVAEGGKKNLKSGDLIGYEENPDISTVATGSFEISIDDEARTLTYELSYSGLEGTVRQAHIHFGKAAVNGGITLFLCGTTPASRGRRAHLPVRHRERSAARSQRATFSRPERKASRPGTSKSSSRRCAPGRRTPTSTPRSGRAARFAPRSTTAGTTRGRD